MQEDQYGRFVEVLKATPAKLSSLLKDMTEDQLGFKPDESTFSLKENLLHLRDLEIEGFGERVRLILAENSPVLRDIDGDKLARLRRYQMADASLAQEQFSQAREANLAYLRNMTGFQYHRKALWNDQEVTLFQVVARWADHDREHLNQMERLVQGIHGAAA
ncbi:MAG TPA: DinB family protein [Terriglobia bacterium]|nr:DinB family protein [Terriglobia bacterium]